MSLPWSCSESLAHRREVCSSSAVGLQVGPSREAGVGGSVSCPARPHGVRLAEMRAPASSFPASLWHGSTGSGSCADPLGRTLLPALHRLFSARGGSPCSSRAGNACAGARHLASLPGRCRYRPAGSQLPWERAAMGSQQEGDAWRRLGLWQVRDVPWHEPQVQVRGLEVRNASQHHFCLLKLRLGFVALEAMGEKLPKHEWAAHPTGKRR